MRNNEDTLGKHFSNYGELQEALILSDTDRGNETGFGYVSFKDPAGPIHALNQQHYILDTKGSFLFSFLVSFCVNCFYAFIPVLISFFFYY